MRLSELSGKRTLLLASSGGHMEQAQKWMSRLKLSSDTTFVSFAGPQIDSLPRDQDRLVVEYIPPRGYAECYRALREIQSALSREDYEVVLSTGAAIALTGYGIARLWRLPMVYIESVSRVQGPSLTGKILSKLPFVDIYCQHEGYPGNRWQLAPSLLTSFERSESTDKKLAIRPLRIFVTLGTIAPYRFDRLVEHVLRALLPGDEVVWQLGSTLRTDLPGRILVSASSDEMESLMIQADVVVTHAGVGTLLKCLNLGKVPVLMARSAKLREHVDEHQGEIARLLLSAGLAEALNAENGRQILNSAAYSLVRDSSTS